MIIGSSGSARFLGDGFQNLLHISI